MELSYIAYISYCHKPLDTAVARKLHTLLEGYVIPPQFRGTPEESIPRELLEGKEPLYVSVAGETPKQVLKNLNKKLPRLAALILGCPYDALLHHWKRSPLQRLLLAWRR